jgi:hypothetical protein
MMSNDEEKRKTLALPDRARDAMLEQAAAKLAAIHTAKQLAAELRPALEASGSRGPLPSNLRLPVGDILFGVAQLQVEFARRLFEFNREASGLLRERLRKSSARPVKRGTIQVACNHETPPELVFTIKNTASMSKSFTFRAEVCDKHHQQAPLPPATLETTPPTPPVTIPAGQCREIKRTFSRELAAGIYPGDVAVETQGIQVELIPFEIRVTS